MYELNKTCDNCLKADVCIHEVERDTIIEAIEFDEIKHKHLPEPYTLVSLFLGTICKKHLPKP